MKDLKDQVTSLDLSQQLEKTGYKQEGLWWWSNGVYAVKGVIRTNKEWMLGSYEPQNKEKCVAPTVCELGKAITKYAKHGKDLPYWDYGWYCPSYMNVMLYYDNPKSIVEKTEANARAKMWLYLKREGLL